MGGPLAYALLMLAVGLAVLVAASDRVVVIAVRLSVRWRVSPVLVGALIVGLGTSIPELLVSGIAASDGDLDVAVANVVASNAANVTLVVGSAALVFPLVVTGRLLTRQVPLMAAAALGLALVVADGAFTRYEAIALLLGMVVSVFLLILWASHDERGECDASDSSVLSDLAVGAVAIAATVAGANVLLDAASDIATEFGWSAPILGLLLGVGTSLPEVATALAAARRKHADLVIGNVVGSNIFNSLAVAGAAGVIGGGPLGEYRLVTVWVMLAAIALVSIAMWTGRRVSALEGSLLLVVFAVMAVLAA